MVSPFGRTPDEQRAFKQVLKHLVRKILVPRGYKVVRADEIAREGLITNQIIEHLLEDELVVADLTGLNPNVFYELAVRHAARKPIVHLITKGNEIPFDVANMRAVFYALDDPDALEAAQEEFTQMVQSIEESGWQAGPNPISFARDVWLLRQSGEPEAQDAAAFLAAMNEVRDEVRALSRRVDSSPRRSSAAVNQLAMKLAQDQGMKKQAAARAIEALLPAQSIVTDAGRYLLIGPTEDLPQELLEEVKDLALDAGFSGLRIVSYQQPKPWVLPDSRS